LNTANVPLIPYLGLYPRDLTSLEESPTLISDMINFTKLREIWKIVNQFIKFQSSKFKILPNPEVIYSLKNVDIFETKMLKELSEQFEPLKKKKKEDVVGEKLTDSIKGNNDKHSSASKTMMKMFTSQNDNRKEIEKFQKEQGGSMNSTKGRKSVVFVDASDNSSVDGNNSGSEDDTIMPRPPTKKSPEIPTYRDRSSSAPDEKKEINNSILRKGQLSKLSLRSSKNSTDVIQRQKIDNMFSQLKKIKSNSES